MFKHGHKWSDNHRQFRLEPKSHDGEDGEHSGNYPLLETLYGWLTPFHCREHHLSGKFCVFHC